MQLTDLQFLTSDAGVQLLERLRGEDLRDSNTLRLITLLRKQYTADEARAALELAQLRVKAVGKFGAAAGQMYFTRDALEQASHPLVSAYRARDAAGWQILDICVGIGGDALPFAVAGAHVTGVDLDPVRVEMARLNALALGVDANFELGDARNYPVNPQTDLIFFDPARRDAQGRRIHQVEAYQPPLSLINAWDVPRKMVKVSPGVDVQQLAVYGGEVWFISVMGDLKEALLVLNAGDSIRQNARKFKAVLLTDDATLEWSDIPLQETSLSEPRQFLLEPDAALIRAGLVTNAAQAFDAYQLDESIAYLTADHVPSSAWVKAWNVLHWMPFSVKALRAYLRDQHVGNVTVKKRGTAVTPEALIPQLKLKGTETRTLILSRLKGEQIVMVCDERPLMGCKFEQAV